MIKKYIYLLLTGIFVCTATVAQTISRHEISATLGGGLSTLDYSTDLGKQKACLGGNIGLGYTYFFTENWGLTSGLEFTYYGGKVTDVNLLSLQPGQIDSNGKEYDYYSEVSGYKEDQHSMFINIPVMANYQIPVHGDHKFYALAGVKVGIPVIRKYHSKGDTNLNKGWYIDEENWAETQKFAGFGRFYDRDVKGDVDFKIAFMASAEAGMKWELNNGMSLYTGAYCDYGLNDIVKDGHGNAFVIQEIEPDRYFFSNNSILESSYYSGYAHEGGTKKDITDKVVPLALGVKLRLVFMNR